MENKKQTLKEMNRLLKESIWNEQHGYSIIKDNIILAIALGIKFLVKNISERKIGKHKHE